MNIFKKTNVVNCLLICLIIIGSLVLISSVSASESYMDTTNLDDSNQINLGYSSPLNEDSLVVADSDLESISSLSDSSNQEVETIGPDLEDSDENIVYVSNKGSDSNSGLSEDDAYKTVNKALESYYLNNKSIEIHLDEGTFKSENAYQIFVPDEGESHLISIIGSGVNKTILDGEGLHNFFNIESGMSVLLKDLSFINGFDTINGGAILNQGNLTLINVYFYNNTVYSGDASIHSYGPLASGGAIYNGGEVIIENASFICNKAGSVVNLNARGGAICNYGKLTVNNSYFDFNNLESRIDYTFGVINDITANQKGASIASFSDDVSVSNTLFYNNLLPVMEKAPTDGFGVFSGGAAVYIEGNNYDFINCSFENNTADVAGAIYFMGNNLNLIDCIFKNNSAYICGVIIVYEHSFSADWTRFRNLTQNKYENITIENCNFNNNYLKSSRAMSGASAIGLLKMDNIHIYNSNFTDNGFLNNTVEFDSSSQVSIFTSGSLTILGKNSTITKSNFINNTAHNGGAIYNYGFDTIISDSYFANNIALDNDGGAIFHSIGDLIVNNCTFDSNNASKNGGSIFASYDYSNNYMFEQKSIYNNSRFYNSQGEYGGAIYDTGNSVIFENLEFVNNTAFYGGAVYKQGFSNTFRNSTFIRNSALTKDYSNGGAIYNYGGNLLIESCDFDSNIADLYGGALFNFGESSAIINNSFSSNNGFSGGSVYLSGNGGRFSGNEIDSSFAVYGGGLYNTVTNLICVNNSFTDCKANVSGGAIYNLASTLQLYANNMENCEANLSGVGTGNYVFTSGNISYLVVSFLNSETVNMVDNQSVLLFANVTDNMGNPITGGNVSFILFNGSDDGESTIVGTSEVLEGIAYLTFNLPLELGTNYSISGSYSYGAEPISTQVGNIKSVLSTIIYLSSDIVDDTVIFGDNFTYEMILLDSENNYIANAEILVYLDGVYQQSVFTNDAGYLNETVSMLPISGKHYLHFIYEGDVFHNRAAKDLNFTVFYNNTYYYDDIVISFVDLAYSIVHVGVNTEIPVQFMIYHNKTGEVLYEVSTYRYFNTTVNGEPYDDFLFTDYLGEVRGQAVIYSIFEHNGKLVKVYRTSPDGIFEFNATESHPGVYEYNIQFVGGLVKHFNQSTHNGVNEEDNIYNPCNISFILIVDGHDANIQTKISYEGPNNFSEIDLPYYTFNLTDKNNNPLINQEIRIYDNGSYIASAFTDGSGFAEYQFEEGLDMGKHILEFIYVGEENYSSSYSIVDLNVFENPYKENLIISNKSSLNLIGPNNNFTAQLKDFYNNNMSNFTINVKVETHEFGHIDKNRFSKQYTVVTDENGMFSIPLELGSGVYQINCSYAGSKWYRDYYKVYTLNLTKTSTLLFGQSSIEVLKNESYLTVVLATEDLKVLPNYKITYYVFSDDYAFILNETDSFDSLISDSKAIYYAFTNESSISRLKINLPVGKYALLTVFGGDKWYNTSCLITNLTIYGEESKLEANQNIIIKESGYYTVRLLDSNGNPIAGESINITVNGKSYSRMTDSNGEARLEINLAYGNYTIVSKFKGNINYTSSELSSNLYVVDADYKYPSVLRLNSSEIYRSQGYYEVILTGINNESLVHRNIIVNVNGTNYTIRTNNDGVAHLDYDFTIGTYIVTAYFAGDNDYQYSSITSTLTVVSENAATTFLNSSVYYVLKGKGGFYTVSLLDKLGNPIAGQRIYFNLNNKEYSNITDKKGNANLIINLNPGSYDINSTFRGTDVLFASSTYSKLVVLPDDNATNGSNSMDNNVNKTVKLSTKIVASNMIKYYKDSKKLVITLKDSKNKTIAGRNITIVLNGKTYKGATDKNGRVNLLVNLKNGKYTVKIRFAGDKYFKASSKNLTVKVVLPKIKAVKTTVKRNKKLQVKFLTYNGKAIKNQKVTFRIKGKTYTVKTNSKGIASLKIKVKKGTYKVKLGFKNTKTYGKYTKTIQVKVK